MTKYQQVIAELYRDHQAEMEAFQAVHDKYMDNQKKFQDEFNEMGVTIMDLLHFYERQLCGKSERSGMGVYSSKLAEKFWVEIKKKLPMIDFVGVKIS
jgi:hypothetical protein